MEAAAESIDSLAKGEGKGGAPAAPAPQRGGKRPRSRSLAESHPPMMVSPNSFNRALEDLIQKGGVGLAPLQAGSAVDKMEYVAPTSPMGLEHLLSPPAPQPTINPSALMVEHMHPEGGETPALSKPRRRSRGERGAQM